MSDYFAMGSGIASAYSDGTEEKRLRDRQIEQDARQKVVDAQRDKDFGDRQTVFGQGQKVYNDTTQALGGDAGAPAAPAAANNPSAYVPPVAGLPAGPGAAGAPAAGLPASSAPAAAPVKFDPHLARLTQARDLARASRDVQGLNAANAAIAQHQISLEDGATAKGVMDGTPEQHMELFKHVNVHSKTLTMTPKLDAKGKPTGYTNLSIVQPDGSAVSSTLSLADLAKVAVAEKKIQRGDMTGLDDLHAVSAALAAAAASEMGMVEKVNTSNNDSESKRVTGVAHTMSAQAAQTSAGAAATNAATQSRMVGAQIGEIDANRAELAKARGLMTQLDSLTPEEQNGAKGLALRRQFNVLNARPGTQLSTPDPRTAGAATAAKYQTDNEWADAEKKLVGDNTPPAAIAVQKEGFYARRGFAPPSAVNSLMGGRDLKTGDKLTAEDVDSFNRTFPHSQVDPTSLPWLKPRGLPTKAAPAAPPRPTRTSSDGRRYAIPVEQPAQPFVPSGLPLASGD